MANQMPGVRPSTPHFSSGPCAKRPGWSLQALTDAALGRSHRAKLGKAKLKRAIDLTREVLQVPGDYRLGIVPASDTGAVEMALWSLLGPRPVTMLTWESFGEGWVNDTVKELKLKNVTVLRAAYGELPDLARVDAAGAEKRPQRHLDGPRIGGRHDGDEMARWHFQDRARQRDGLFQPGFAGGRAMRAAGQRAAKLACCPSRNFCARSRGEAGIVRPHGRLFDRHSTTLSDGCPSLGRGVPRTHIRKRPRPVKPVWSCLPRQRQNFGLRNDGPRRPLLQRRGFFARGSGAGPAVRRICCLPQGKPLCVFKVTL